MVFPEGLVIGDVTDDRVGLTERRRRGGDVRGAVLECTFDSAIGHTAAGQQGGADGFDVGAGVVAGEIGEPVDRALAGSAESCEQLMSDPCAVRPDLFDAAHETQCLARGIEQAVAVFEYEVTFTCGLRVATQDASIGVADLDVAVIDPHGDDAAGCGR